MTTPLDLSDTRDAALFALARSKYPDAIPVLRRAFQSEDVRCKIVAAFALYALGDQTGAEVVDAYRQRKEKDLPGASERWSFDLNGNQFLAPAITYLESPKLIAAYFERTRDSFRHDDVAVAQDRDFIDRHQKELVAMLMSHIENRGVPQMEVMDCLSAATGEYNVILRVKGADQRQAMVQWWKDYVVTHGLK